MHRIESIRSKTVVLELEVTVLKSKTENDRLAIEHLAGNNEAMQQNVRELAERVRRVEDSITLLHSLNQGMQDAVDEATRSRTCVTLLDHAPGQSLASEFASAGTIILSGPSRVVCLYAPRSTRSRYGAPHVRENKGGCFQIRT